MAGYRRLVVTGADVDEAVAFLVRTLRPHASEDWSVRAGPLSWSCQRTAVHLAHDLLAYAGQVAGAASVSESVSKSESAAGDYLPVDLRVHGDASPAQLLDVVQAIGRLLAVAVDAAAPDVRAWHWGPTDPAGFAALGVNEVLVHAHDIGTGLGVPWTPPLRLCRVVLERLFPDAPPGPAGRTLLWCTGRATLGERPRRRRWTAAAAVDQLR
jgi:hypothetical protein